MFCCDHKGLVCTTCSNSDHQTCLIKSVDDVCKTISTLEGDSLFDAIETLNDKAKSIKDAIEAYIGELAEQRKHMMQGTKDLQEQVTSKMNELFQNIQSDIA